jgi:hypothetical protein
MNAKYLELCKILYNEYAKKAATKRGCPVDQLPRQVQQSIFLRARQSANSMVREMDRKVQERAQQRKRASFDRVRAEMSQQHATLPPFLLQTPTLSTPEARGATPVLPSPSLASPLPVTPTPASTFLAQKNLEVKPLLADVRRNASMADMSTAVDLRYPTDAAAMPEDLKTSTKEQDDLIFDHAVTCEPDPGDTMEQACMKFQEARYSRLKHRLLNSITKLNLCIDDPAQPGAPILCQHDVQLCMVDIIMLACGVHHLRYYMHRREPQDVASLAVMAGKRIPLFIPKVQDYVKDVARTICSNNAKWAAVMKVPTEIYHQFAVVHSVMLQKDASGQANPGQPKLVEALGVSKADMWQYLAPQPDQEFAL